VDLGQIYRLVLEPQSALTAPLLKRYLQLVVPLLAGPGASFAGRGGVTESGRREMLVAVPVLGLLLLKLGFRKERYMESREFLLGQYLQHADRLHKLYCEVVRDGKIPPQLVGNATLGAALQNPERAFQSAGQRIRPYWAWADSVSTGDKAGLAIWVRRRIGDVCGQLAQQGLSSKIDDVGRAQLFLGYLGDMERREAKV
jgi:hypothetical protein